MAGTHASVADSQKLKEVTFSRDGPRTQPGPSRPPLPVPLGSCTPPLTRSLPQNDDKVRPGTHKGRASSHLCYGRTTLSESYDLSGPWAPHCIMVNAASLPGFWGGMEERTYVKPRHQVGSQGTLVSFQGELGGWVGGLSHAGRGSECLTHGVLAQGLHQGSVSALEATAGTSRACGSRL